ncbi:MAG: hypothetical protein AMXMBFR46_28970 [Acidimicrobiia bacterium]
MFWQTHWLRLSHMTSDHRMGLRVKSNIVSPARRLACGAPGRAPSYHTPPFRSTASFVWPRA